MHFSRLCVVAGLFVMSAQVLHAQPLSSGPSYEAVSIKPNRTGDPRIRLNTAPDGGFTMTNGSLSILLGQAFPQSTVDMPGLPDWAATERFDVVARGVTDGSKPNGEQRALMLQKMLIERFKLKTHVEKREQPAYDLVIARSDGRLGPQLARSDFDCAVHSKAIEAARASGEPLPSPPTLAGGIPACTQRSTTTRFDGHMTMTSLTRSLRSMTDRVVVDKTGLTGYVIATLDVPQTPELRAQPDAPSVFTAVQEQLGLRLVPSRTTVEVLVIDNVERPTEN